MSNSKAMTCKILVSRPLINHDTMRASGYYSFNIIDNFTYLSILEIAEITNHTPNLLRLKGVVNKMTNNK